MDFFSSLPNTIHIKKRCPTPFYRTFRVFVLAIVHGKYQLFYGILQWRDICWEGTQEPQLPSNSFIRRDKKCQTCQTWQEDASVLLVKFKIWHFWLIVKVWSCVVMEFLKLQIRKKARLSWGMWVAYVKPQMLNPGKWNANKKGNVRTVDSALSTVLWLYRVHLENASEWNSDCISDSVRKNSMRQTKTTTSCKYRYTYCTWCRRMDLPSKTQHKHFYREPARPRSFRLPSPRIEDWNQ